MTLAPANPILLTPAKPNGSGEPIILVKVRALGTYTPAQESAEWYLSPSVGTPSFAEPTSVAVTALLKTIGLGNPFGPLIFVAIRASLNTSIFAVATLLATWPGPSSAVILAGFQRGVVPAPKTTFTPGTGWMICASLAPLTFCVSVRFGSARSNGRVVPGRNVTLSPFISSPAQVSTSAPPSMFLPAATPSKMMNLL